MTTTSPMELVQRFRSFQEWRIWANDHPFIFSHEHTAQIMAQIRGSGVVDPLTGVTTPPSEVVIRHDNYRETIKSGNLISRHRGLLMELKHLANRNLEHLLSRQCKAYAPEALTQLFEPFNRFGQEGGNEAASGSSLVVTRRMIEIMGGAIGVSSTVGEGSV